MVYYDEQIKKNIKKGYLPKQIVKLFHNAFKSLDLTNDLNLFDIKKLKSSGSINYYRLRKNKYRAIFFIDNNDYFVITINKREEVYKKWL